ncbi:MAG TPA: NAD(P)H-dependent oxidoreductase subunit E [Candidatus Limnocylindrales bacterium]|jgi:NADH-quinone oxidoreductase subunit E|nr:NAD(P)H-dependent oxidoreductase subunit E [Candidatus Limnocylindrales bacterium]
MSLSDIIPGYGLVKGMAIGFLRIFERKPTVQYPEVVQEISPRHRGRLILLYDEYGTLKCETCFQCAQACPIECIDMGGVDTKNRFHVHWGPAEQYAERREESAVRRAGRVVPDPVFAWFRPVDLGPLDVILEEEDYDPRRMLRILDRTQEQYGHLPVAALKHISFQTGAWYSEIYGIATSYPARFRMEPASAHEIGLCRCPACLMRGAGRIEEALIDALGTGLGGTSPDGAVRFASIDCHGDSSERALVTLDGEPQREAAPEAIARLAQRLRTGHAVEARV